MKFLSKKYIKSGIATTTYLINHLFVTMLICFLPAVNMVFGQQDNFAFKHLTKDQGLSSNSVNCIFEDSEGYMWFGTKDGLSRYNGYDFVIFKNIVAANNSISSNYINVLYENTASGNIWIGTKHGLNLFIKSTYTFQRFRMPGSENILSLCYTPKDSLLLIGTDRGLYVYNPENGYITLFDQDLSGFSIQAIYAKETGDILLGTGNGVYKHQKTGVSKLLPGIIKNPIVFIQTDSRNDIWIGTDKGGLFELRGDNLSIKNAYDNNSGLFTTARIYGMAEFKTGEFFVAERDGGLHYFKKKNGHVKKLESDIHTDKSISSKSLLSVTSSSSGIVWLGTYNSGISYLDFRAKAFKHYKLNFKPDGIFNNNIRSLLVDKQGSIWVGTKENGGISRFFKETGTFYNIPHRDNDKHTPGGDYIFSLEEYNNRYLLLGTFKNGLEVFDREKQIFTSYNNVDANNTAINHVRVYALKKDTLSLVWVGTHKSLQVFDFEQETFTTIDEIPSVRVIMKDGPGRIWVGTKADGVFVYDKNKGVIKQFRHNANNGKSILDNEIFALLKDKQKNYWIGTKEGITVYNEQAEFIRHYTANSGLPTNWICSMQLDNYGNVWASTNNGLVKINNDNNTINTYDVSDGLQGNEFEGYVSCKTKQGELIFGGRNGFNFFNPADIKTNDYVPPVIVTGFSVKNKSIKPGEKGSLLKKHISETKAIKLNHKQNSFSFNFVSLNYTSPEKNRYKYMLDGFDDHWIESGEIRKATYTNIPPGKYIFKLQGSNNDGVWNPNVKEIAVVIPPPLWKVWWFRVLVIITIVFIAYSIYRKRLSDLKRNKNYLEGKVKEGEILVADKLKELEKQKKEIRLRDIQEMETRYINKGLARFGSIIRNESDFKVMCRKILVELAEYTEILQGLLYIDSKNDAEVKTLKLVAHYGMDPKNISSETFELGEGYVGTCFKEKKVMELDNIPEGYIVVDSGLGAKTVAYVVLFPLLQNNEIHGVLELTAFEKLASHKINFIKILSETLAANINNYVNDHKIKEALTIANEQKEELQAQDEEMRQNLEEMAATQEELQRQLDSNELVLNDLSVKECMVEVLMEAHTDFISYKDIKGVFKQFNRQRHPVYDMYQPEDLLDKNEAELLSKKSAIDLQTIENQVVLSGQPMLNALEKYIDSNNRIVELQLSRYPVKAKSHEVIGILTFMKHVNVKIQQEDTE